MRDKQLDLELDRYLDQALTNYANAEEPSHLAAKILATIRQQNPPRRHTTFARWQLWPIAIPTAVAIVLLASILTSHRVPHVSTLRRGIPQATASVASNEKPQNAPALDPSNGTGFSRVPHVSNLRRGIPPNLNAQPLPKQQVFPTPQPLTQPEQTYLALFNRNPNAATEAVSTKPPQPEPDPIHIAAIHIPPLNPSSEGRNE